MKKTVIVGGGIAGLTAGVYAQLNGFKSEIYEKNPVTGGQCMGWDRKGHHIDNCIHWLTGTKKGTKLYKIWETLNAIGDDVEMIHNQTFYTSKLDGKSATLWRDLDKTQRELLQIAPEDAEEIHKLISHVRLAECCEMPVNKPMDMMNIFDYINMGKKMAGMFKVMKEYDKMDIEDLGNRFKNPLIRKLLTDYMCKEYFASSFIISYATMTSGNGDIPMKGSLAMTNRIIKRYKELGGVLHTNKPVKKIIISHNKADGIILNDDTVVHADYVICATDTAETFGRLMDSSYMDKKLKVCYENPNDYPVFSGLQMAFSADNNLFSDETIIFDFKPITIGNNDVTRMSLKSYHYDPSFAPEGKTVLQVNIMQRKDDFDYWKSLNKQDYKNAKQTIAEAVTDRIIECFPKLNGHIELLDCWTPLTYEKYCNSFNGAYMAFIEKKNIKIPRLKGKVNGLSNVFIASQWLQSPGGLPVAAATGKFVIQRILKKEGKSINI